MVTKREIFEQFAKGENCINIECENCPFYKYSYGCTVSRRLSSVGAMAILRMFPEKREFDLSKILTSVTADKAKVGMKGYFADNLAELKLNFKNNILYELIRVREENWVYRFESEHIEYALFYPIDEVEE